MQTGSTTVVNLLGRGTPSLTVPYSEVYHIHINCQEFLSLNKTKHPKLGVLSRI